MLILCFVLKPESAFFIIVKSLRFLPINKTICQQKKINPQKINKILFL